MQIRRLALVAALLLPLPVAAQVGGAFPWSMTFDNQADYQNYLCWETGGPGIGGCDGVLAFTHQSTGCWSGGCAKFRFLGNTGEDNAGLTLQGLTFPGAPPIVYIRWLVYYGPTYCTVQTQGTKILISQPVSGDRAIAFDQDSTSTRGVFICQNIECTDAAPRESGKPVWNICSHPGQWVSYEVKIDQAADTVSIYVDTQDGVQSSAGGTAPYQVYGPSSSSNCTSSGNPYSCCTGIGTGTACGMDGASGGWKNLEWLMGYWEATSGVDANSYFIMDELRINTSYIGPPSGFVSGGPAIGSGLPRVFDMEEGDSSEWDGCNNVSLTWNATNPHGGTKWARSNLTTALVNNDNYCEYRFGNYYSLPAPKTDVAEVWFRGWSRYETTSRGADSEWKVAIFNLMNGASSARCSQVFLWIDNAGNYVVDRSVFAGCTGFGTFTHLTQNQGSPVAQTVNAWDKIKMYVKLNAVGSSDGIVRLWINDVLKLERTDLPIRVDASHTIQKFLLSTYSNSAFTGDLIQGHDDLGIYATDPDLATTQRSNAGVRLLGGASIR